ncbi:hypothetical protein [Thalassotalea crassostreae]|uniref:hypothetical protein n=1 Tax=Thalassotalea crassostreae TaxID=1763536 RepID=UPI0008380917|nr:hypothetical protein [Thalassotalea crassostreae]
MGSIWDNHASYLAKLLDTNDELQAHLFLEQLMLFPVDIQDKIINEISNLPKCNVEDISQIIGFYASRA